jgi:outer membrane lipoprotein-sorting protein
MRRLLMQPPTEANVFPDVRCQGRAPRAAKRSPTLDSGHAGKLRLSLQFLLLSLLFFTFEARPAERAGNLTQDEIRSVIASIKRAYTLAPSFTTDFVQTYTPSGFAAAAPETGHVTLQSPDEIRFDYDGSEGKVFTFDGEAARQYVAADRQMIVRTLGRGERERLPLLFFESPDSVLKRYDASASGTGNGLVELTLTPKAGGEPARIALTVNSEGDVARLVVTDTAGNRTSFTFSGKKAGGRRPASEFALKPPAGTRVITQ